MEKEFILYEQALDLKKLGFDEPCITFYFLNEEELIYAEEGGFWYNSNSEEDRISAPLYQQAFRWFREKYWYTSLIKCDGFEIIMQTSTSYRLDRKTGEQIQVYSTQTYHQAIRLKSYKEAELECLKKLIFIIKQHNK